MDALQRLRNNFSDKVFHLRHFYHHHRRLPCLRGGGLSDALYYLKASGQIREPLRVRVSDKEYVKEYIREKIGEEYNVPTIAILRSVEEMLSFDYPQDCAIKPTHMSGCFIFRHGGAPIDLAKLRQWLQTNYYNLGREQNYRTLTPKIIIEPLLWGRSQVEDYRIFCVHGQPRAIQVDIERPRSTTNMYTLDWNRLPFGLGFPVGTGFARPANLEKMLEIAARLSADFNFIRVDMYTDGEKIYAGELTNCHGNAREKFTLPSADKDFARILFGPEGFSKEILSTRSLKMRKPLQYLEPELVARYGDICKKEA